MFSCNRYFILGPIGELKFDNNKQNSLIAKVQISEYLLSYFFRFLKEILIREQFQVQLKFIQLLSCVNIDNFLVGFKKM